MIYSDILGVISICLSEKDLEIITLNKSSVGNLMPKLRKLLALDSKSVNSKFISFIGKIEFITTKLSCCFD